MKALQDGDWRGRRCFILGGGGSLRHFDFSVLDGELTLGVNMSFLHNPTATLVGDLRLIRRLSTDPRWQKYSGAKLWLNSETPHGEEKFKDVIEVKEHLGRDSFPKWSSSLKDGLWRRTNAGASALNLAEILGADPVYLLGFDMTGRNWHDEYPTEWAPDPHAMRQFKDDFMENADKIERIVVNLNPDSKLRCFPFGDPAKVLSEASR